jgi:hypothetical protein
MAACAQCGRLGAQVARFEEMRLEWHAAQTRDLLTA